MKTTTKHLISRSIAFAILCTGLISCSDSFDTSFFDKEINNTELELEIAGIPIGHSTFTASELFEEIGDDIEVNTTDDNGTDIVSFFYSESLGVVQDTEFLELDDSEISNTLAIFPDVDNYTSGSIPASGSTPEDTIEVSRNDNQELKDGSGSSFSYDLNSAVFSDGTFTILLTTTNLIETEIVFTIPSLKRISDGEVYSEYFILNNDSGDDINTKTLDLNIYEFDFTIDGIEPETNNATNSIFVTVDATLNLDNGDSSSPADILTYNVSLNSPKVQTAEGDFKQKEIILENQTLDLSFFEEIGDGNISFGNPTFKIIATNENELPIGFVLENISTPDDNLAIIDATPTDDNMETITGGTNTYAIINGAITNGTPVTSTITLNKENSNIADIINGKPTEFNLDLTTVSNPNSSGSNTNIFDADNNLELEIEVELPLHVTFEDLAFSPDPFEFEAEDITDNATDLTLRVAAKNSLPLEGEVILKFTKNTGTEDAPVYETLQYTNNSGVLVDFIENIGVMGAAPVNDDGFSIYGFDSNGNLTENGVLVDETIVSLIEFNEAKVIALNEVTHIQAEIIFNTTDDDTENPGSVKLKPEDQVRLDLAIKGNAKISFEDEDEDEDNN